MKISAKIVEHTITPNNFENVTFTCVFPRFILAEVNTHAMFARNSASSRAIPTRKLLKNVITKPFIPIAWQKEHPGMQGTEYFDVNQVFDISELATVMMEKFKKILAISSKEEIDEKFDEIAMTYFKKAIVSTFDKNKTTFNELWLYCRDKCVETVMLMMCMGATKQLCNRLLEPFLWHSCVITTELSGLINFFEQRCPIYYGEINNEMVKFHSKNHLCDILSIGKTERIYPLNDEVEWLKKNSGKAEIHMMLLAEAIYDAYRESVPRRIVAGSWHIPFYKEIAEESVTGYINSLNLEKMKFNHISFHQFEEFIKAKIGVVKCARFSYTTIDTDRYYLVEDDMVLFEKLYNDVHRSPFEHVGLCMMNHEVNTYIRGRVILTQTQSETSAISVEDDDIGWCGKMRGLIPMRYQIERKIKWFQETNVESQS